jgi:hypothetical protein
MYRSLSILCLALLATATELDAQRTAPADRFELDSITERGRLLFEYDQAVLRATDALKEQKLRRARLGRTIARRVGDRWEVVFGRLDRSGDAFQIAYTATQGPDRARYSIAEHEPVLQDSGFFRAAARAIELTSQDFHGLWSAYGTIVLPADSSRLHVYHVPVQLDHEVFPLGSDARYLVSPDGTAIIDRRQMHRRMWEYPSDSLRRAGAEPTESSHVTVVSDAPVETDVMHVLARRPQIDELVVTKQWVYRIRLDGRINYVTTSEKYVNRKGR